MKKRLSVVSKTAAAVSALGIGLLLLISCSNIFAPPQEGNAVGNGETGTVLISVGNGVEGARTLLPSEVTFDHYVLTIDTVPAAGPSVVESITSGLYATVALTPGQWKIHVDAYMDGTDSYKAAQGDSAPFTVSSNATTSVSVDLAAISGDEPGILSVHLTGEDAYTITYGQFFIYSGLNFNDELGSGGFSSSLTTDIPLPPGQYRVYAEIRNDNYQAAYINEVAYIYSNLTTNLDRMIGAADFTDITAISGTVQYTENGVDQYDYSFDVYTNPEGSGSSFGSAWIGSTGVQPYEFRIPRPDKDVTLYFFIYKDGNRFLADSISITAGQVSVTKDININRDTFDLSGTVAVTMAGSTPVGVYIYAYAEEGNSSFPAIVESGGAWTISGIPTDFSGTLNFGISAEDSDGQQYSANNIGFWTSGESTTGISLNVSFIKVTGSFTATVDSASISNIGVSVSAYREWVPGSGNFNEYLNGSSYSSWSGNTCYWTLGMPALSTSTKVELNIYLSGSARITETVTLGTSNETVPPKTYNYRTLSGTVGAVTVNRITPSYVYIYADISEDGGFSGSSSSFPLDSSGAWQTYIPSNFSGTVTIGVNAEYEDTRARKDVYTWTSGSSTTGINLGNVNFFTLSGSYGTVTVNGQTPYRVDVYARPSSGYNSYYYNGESGNNGNWQIAIPDDFSGTLIIGVEAAYGEEGWYSKDIITWTSDSGSTTGINLGNADITINPISGTVTTNGTSPMKSGQAVVFSPPEGEVLDFYDLFGRTPLGYVEIANGAFSGYYVDEGVTTGYVVIVDMSDYTYCYVNKSPVTLGTSMNFRLSTMAKVAIPPGTWD
jgi:hypothetical protein